MRIRRNLFGKEVATGEHGNGVAYILARCTVMLVMTALSGIAYGQTALMGVASA